MFGLSTFKLVGIGVGILALLGLVIRLRHYKGLADARGQSLAVICQTTRTASNNPKLKCGEVPSQISFMGQAIQTLTDAIHKQNDAVNALGAQTKKQQADAEKASQAASKRAQGALATSQRLNASSRSGTPPCEPSKALKGAWQ